MIKPKLEFKKQTIYNPEFSPQVPAKRPNLRKKIIGGQKSAQQGRRPPRQIIKNLESDRLSEQHVRNSTIYRLLEDEMRMMANQHQIELNKLKKIKEEKDKQKGNLQKEQHQVKLQIWELKNQLMDLKDQIKEEKEETTRLMSEIGLQPQQQLQSD